jgi:hypothetical protein
MKLREIAASGNWETLQANTNDTVVGRAYTSDLLSDVMANAHDSDLLITIQAHNNTVAVASLAAYARHRHLQRSPRARRHAGLRPEGKHRCFSNKSEPVRDILHGRKTTGGLAPCWRTSITTPAFPPAPLWQ